MTSLNSKTKKDGALKLQYVISCYAPKSSLYSVPIRASTDWLKKALARQDVINGEPLTQSEFRLLKTRLDWRIEITWHPRFRYFVEAVSKATQPVGT